MTDTCSVEIDLQAIRQNYLLLSQNGRKLIPIIKANAYGHGIISVARLLSEFHPDYFGVGTIEEGEKLRKADIQTPVLSLLGPAHQSNLDQAFQNHILPTLHNMEGLKATAEYCASSGKSIYPFCLKINTGMNRFGFNEKDIPDLLNCLNAYPCLRPELLLSHFSSADDLNDKSFTEKQILLFSSVLQELKQRYPLLKSSLSNSAGNLLFPNLPFDYTRVGFTLYGGKPFENDNLKENYIDKSERNILNNLKEAMTVSAPVMEIRTVQKGESLSYNRTKQADKKMKIAIIGAGYADGYPRILSNKGYVLLNGEKAPIVGRICMETMLVDISHIKNVALGDKAYLIGNGLSVKEVARLAETIPYELWCNLGHRQI